jgi:parallel beta-helix repeat protein
MLCGVALGAMLALGAGRAAEAATICVNPGGTGGCEASIGAAVTRATPGDTITVAAGTYAESITIGKSLSLIGADPTTTIIDARHLGAGIYVDGIDPPHFTGVVITGFTVQNADYEGIVAANASAVTIWNNRVIHNDRKLIAASSECPGISPNETAEGFDCGEGIHLLGADHSIVAKNEVFDNAGGILLSDDTGPVHDNIVMENFVHDNAFDCGITLASHPPAAITGAHKSLGVYQNTVAGNVSTANGLKLPGNGAGVGLFASVPGAATYSNVVIGNTLTNNGLPGVTMHSHTPGQILTNNIIIGNKISGNAADTEDAATSGPTGINVFGVSSAGGTVITGNTISDESIDVAVKTPGFVAAHLNSLLGTGMGVSNTGTGVVDATQNWWGCAGGPGGTGCSTASGPKILTAPALTAAP